MQYRREIDGLRAVAVVPVILFHAGYPAFSGGYVGVDIFFVISGYLITTIILAEMEKGTFSLTKFYERRARRILPALFFVMLVSIGPAWLWMAPTDFMEFVRSVAAVSTFSSNIFFWLDSGYWGTENELKPMLHTWSLAVEEQFYALFPLYLLLMWRFRRRWIFGSFLVVAAFGLLLAQWGAHSYPTATFFLLPTRAWELAIGSLIAFCFLYRKQRINELTARRRVDDMLGLLGLAMIIVSVLVFDQNTPFPSFYALIPTLGTGLIIIFASQDSNVGRLLGTKILVGLGLISYSAYLWHQPLFVFARHRSLQSPGPITYAWLSILAIALAYFSWRYIEKPFRNAAAVNRKTVFSFALIGSVGFLAIGLSGGSNYSLKPRLELPATVANSFTRSERALECSDFHNIHIADEWKCKIGSPLEIKPSFFVVGDSHAVPMFEAIDKIARQQGLSGYFSSASGCTPFLDIHSLSRDQDKKNCNAFNSRVYDFVRSKKIPRIILVARWTYYTDGGYDGSNFSFVGLSQHDRRNPKLSRQAFEYGLHQTILSYSNIGVGTIFIRQVPQQLHSPRRIYYKAYSTGKVQDWLSTKSVTRDDHNALQAYVDSLFLKADKNSEWVFYEDAAIGLCEKTCMVGTADVSFWADDDHLSVAGAQVIEEELSLLLSKHIFKHKQD